jgi:phosphonate transport system permease protein
MSAKNISLVLLGVILLGSLVWLLVTGFRRKDPVAMEGKSHFWTRSWNYVFGTRKAQKFESPEEAFYFSPHRWLLDVFFALILLFVLIFMNLDLDLGSKFQSVPKWSDIGDILGKLFQIDWDYFFGIGIDAMGVPYTFEVSVLYQIFQTFGIAFIGTLVAALLALPFGLLGSHKLFGRKAWISDVFLILIRTFPELLLGMMLVASAGPNAMAGVLALSLHGIGMIGKLYAEDIDNIEMGPLEGLAAAGATGWQKIHLGIMPQARPDIYSVVLYRFDINIRTATILGVVCGNGCGIGFSLSSLNLYTDARKLGACLFGILILTITIDLFSSWLRKKIV